MIKKINNLIKVIMISISPGYADRIAEKYWSSSLQTHGDLSDAFFQKLCHKVVDIVKPKKGENILDYGCGSGEVTSYLLEKGYQVDGCDISDLLLSKARERGVNAFKCDNYNSIEKHAYDKIYLSGVFLYIHPKKRVGFLIKMFELLKDNGLLYLIEEPDYNKRKAVFSEDKIYMFILNFCTVYSFKNAGFFTKGSVLKNQALKSGFKKIEKVDSDANYRSHFVLSK